VQSRLERIKELQDRTKRFAVAVVRFFSRLPQTEAASVIGRQLLRAGTSVAANYRAACRAQSAADVISKISIVLEETVLARIARGCRHHRITLDTTAHCRMSSTSQDILGVTRHRKS